MMLLKKIGKISTGNTPSKKHREYYNSDDIGFVKPDSISDTVITEINKTSSFISENAREKARVAPKGSILITCIGSVGKVGIVTDGEYAFNQQINAIMPNKDVNQKYLAYNLLYNKQRLINIANAPVVPIVNKTQLENFEINFDSNIDTQKKIVEQLDGIALVIDKRKKQLDALDELIKARFIEVFGDMLLNSKSWREIRLDSVADIVSGITKGRKIKSAELYEVPYMAVSNVKNGYIDWTKVKTIMATKEEIKRYKLLPNDVLMTEGGDPDKLGRGAIIKCPPNNCIHQNHIFRVRLNEELLPIYFEYYLQQIKAKRYFLKCSKQTTGIASINMKQLLALPVLIPDMESQKTFAKFKEQADKSKAVIEKSLKELETLQASLMQKYFS